MPAVALLLAAKALSFTVWRQPDGKKYPNQVKESYELTDDGRLHYSAYFGGMPTNMNHNDSVDWKGGDRVKHVLEVAEKLADDMSTSKLNNADSVFFVTFEKDKQEFTRHVAGVDKGWVTLNAAFLETLAAFEKETHRPLSPNDLPQGTGIDAAQAVKLAVPVANAALDRAYKEWMKNPQSMNNHPPHPQPWVDASGADVRSSGPDWMVKWLQAMPSGFEFEVTIIVSGENAQVVNARASYAAD